MLEDLRGTGMAAILVKSALCIICGGAIGLDREINRQAAGFRTHIVVCVGACIAMLTGQYITLYISESSDTARLGAQVISGIGFLGAGTIISTDVSHRVRGLTTAAGLWAAACIGLAVGIGYYEAAIVGSAAVSATMVAFKRIDKMFFRHSRVLMVYFEMDSVEHVHDLVDLLRADNLSISSIEVQKPKSGMKRSVGVSLTVRKSNREDSADILELINSAPGLIFIETAV
ncbi:MAG: MgtC/SapB family protein [Lachnospiraceae bacterium]|nr:MgtC/SapB family protein [Lachnospiraceae bacterium]